MLMESQKLEMDLELQKRILKMYNTRDYALIDMKMK